MTNSWQPHFEILPPAQQLLWRELTDIPKEFVLYGGTALALRLGHRTSIDFDFFSNREFTPTQLEREISFLQEAQRVQSSPNTLVCLVKRLDWVKVSFFGNLDMRCVHPPVTSPETDLLVASLLDLAATKVKVVQDRAEAKDYLDVARLLQERMNLAEMLAAAQVVYGKHFNPLLSLKALCYFEDGDLPSLDPAIRTRLTAAVSHVDLPRLPMLQSFSKGLIPTDLPKET